MGWLWTSPTEAPPPKSPSNIQTPSPITATAPPSSPQAKARDFAEPDLQDILKSLQPPKSSGSTSSPTQTSTSDSSPPNLEPHQEERLTSQDIYPTEVSCRTAFDTAFYCASLGGQFTNLYRYGQLRSCSEQWGDFWWCLRTNRGFMGQEEREARVMRRAWEKEQVLKKGPMGSSEDVWEQRRWKVKGAFEGDYETLTRAGREEVRDDEAKENTVL